MKRLKFRSKTLTHGIIHWSVLTFDDIFIILQLLHANASGNRRKFYFNVSLNFKLKQMIVIVFCCCCCSWKYCVFCADRLLEMTEKCAKSVNFRHRINLQAEQICASIKHVALEKQLRCNKFVCILLSSMLNVNVSRSHKPEF